MYKFDGPEEVEIKRIPRPGYFGITSFGKGLTRVGSPITVRGNKTGLTKEEESHYEKLLNLKSGELDSHSDWWNDVFNVKYSIMLFNSKTTKLILDNPINQIRYKVLLVSNKIANSEMLKNPEAEFYIDNKELKAKAESESLDYEIEAMEMMFKMSPEEKRTALRLFGKDKLDDLSETMLKSELGKQLKRDPKRFVETLSDVDLNIKSWILELIEKGILIRSGNTFKYNNEVIAGSMDGCIDFFKKPINQDLRLIASTNLEKLKKGKPIKNSNKETA